MKTNKSLSWFWVIFWVILFFPIGFYLFIKKLTNDKAALMSSRRGILSIAGWILLVFGIIGFIAGVDDGDIGLIIFTLLFIIGGVMVLRKSKESKKLAYRYKKYIDMIIYQNIRSIDSISMTINLPYDYVLNDLQNMINIGYLKDAIINQSNGELIFSKDFMESKALARGSSESTNRSKVLKCSGCGANNIVIEGIISECEYCGTLIS